MHFLVPYYLSMVFIQHILLFNYKVIHSKNLYDCDDLLTSVTASHTAESKVKSHLIL